MPPSGRCRTSRSCASPFSPVPATGSSRPAGTSRPPPRGDRSAGHRFRAAAALPACTAFWDLSKPVIAAVNGVAIAGGCELALGADLMIVADHAEFALSEVTVGLVADAGGIARLPRRVPPAIASELLLTGRRFSAQEAKAWGLANAVVPRRRTDGDGPGDGRADRRRRAARRRARSRRSSLRPTACRSARPMSMSRRARCRSTARCRSRRMRARAPKPSSNDARRCGRGAEGPREAVTSRACSAYVPAWRSFPRSIRSRPARRFSKASPTPCSMAASSTASRRSGTPSPWPPRRSTSDAPRHPDLAAGPSGPARRRGRDPAEAAGPRRVRRGRRRRSTRMPRPSTLPEAVAPLDRQIGLTRLHPRLEPGDQERSPALAGRGRALLIPSSPGRRGGPGARSRPVHRRPADRPRALRGARPPDRGACGPP